MGIFVDYEKFMKKFNLKNIANYYPDKMDIVKIRCAMNESYVVFNRGDYILVNGLESKKRILAFAGYDNDYLGAIVLYSKTSAKFVRLHGAVNVSRLDETAGTLEGLLYQYEFRPISKTEHVRGYVSIELNNEDSNASLWRESSKGDEYILVKDKLDYNMLEKALKKISEKDSWNKRSSK